jgi:hypothetical protein
MPTRQELLAGDNNTFEQIIEDPYADPDELRERYTAFSYTAFHDALMARGDL